MRVKWLGWRRGGEGLNGANSCWPDVPPSQHPAALPLSSWALIVLQKLIGESVWRKCKWSHRVALIPVIRTTPTQWVSLTASWICASDVDTGFCWQYTVGGVHCLELSQEYIPSWEFVSLILNVFLIMTRVHVVTSCHDKLHFWLIRIVSGSLKFEIKKLFWIPSWWGHTNLWKTMFCFVECNYFCPYSSILNNFLFSEKLAFL